MVGSISFGQSFNPLAAFSAPASGLTNAIPSAAQSAKTGGENAGGLASSSAAAGEEELSEDEEKVVSDLKKRDAEVRAHEEAHARVGGSYASNPTYEFVEGPDGRKYAVAGEVQIDASPIEGKPEATVQKLEIVIRAALAPADPSAQDLKVAQQAREEKLKAQAEINAKREEELNGEEDEDESNPLDPQTSPNDALSALLQIQENTNNGEDDNKNNTANPGITNTQNTQALNAYRDPLKTQNTAERSEKEESQNNQFTTALLRAAQSLESFSALV